MAAENRDAPAVILDEKAMERTIVRISFEVVERNRGAENLCVVGIMGGGTEIAGRIAAKIGQIEGREIEVGSLDITPHRDDEGRTNGGDRSSIPFDITDKRVVLVDDVLYTGRTVRAAIDAIMSRGRPKNIQLAILIDRGHRELPIRSDVVGKNVPTAAEEKIVVHTKGRHGADEVLLYRRGSKAEG